MFTVDLKTTPNEFEIAAQALFINPWEGFKSRYLYIPDNFFLVKLLHVNVTASNQVAGLAVATTELNGPSCTVTFTGELFVLSNHSSISYMSISSNASFWKTEKQSFVTF